MSDAPAINLMDNAAKGQCKAPGGATDLLSSVFPNISNCFKVCLCVRGGYVSHIVNVFVIWCIYHLEDG